jgi:segregation and condensation protein B
VSLATVLERPVTEVKAAIARLVADFDGVDGTVQRGFELREIGGGWRIYVRESYDELVRDVVLSQNSTKLSQPALETLAVIAYKQPVTRSQVSGIRAVNVDTVIRTLVGRGLITEVGTEPETGAILYGTTDLLLTNLGIDSLDQLPPVSELLDDGSAGFDDVH